MKNNKKEKNILPEKFCKSFKYNIYITSDAGVGNDIITEHHSPTQNSLERTLELIKDRKLVKVLYIHAELRFPPERIRELSNTVFDGILNSQTSLDIDRSNSNQLDLLHRDFINLSDQLSIPGLPRGSDILAAKAREDYINALTFINSIIIDKLFNLGIDQILLLACIKAVEVLSTARLQLLISTLNDQQKELVLHLAEKIDGEVHPNKKCTVATLGKIINNQLNIEEISNDKKSLEVAIGLSIAIGRKDLVETLLDKLCKLLDCKITDDYNYMIMYAASSFVRGNPEICKLFVQKNIWQIMESQDQLRLVELLFERGDEETINIVLEELFVNGLLNLNIYQNIIDTLPRELNAETRLEPFLERFIDSFSSDTAKHLRSIKNFSEAEIEAYVKENIGSINPQELTGSTFEGFTLASRLISYHNLISFESSITSSKKKSKNKKQGKKQNTKKSSDTKETEEKQNDTTVDKKLTEATNDQNDEQIPPQLPDHESAYIGVWKTVGESEDKKEKQPKKKPKAKPVTKASKVKNQENSEMKAKPTEQKESINAPKIERTLEVDTKETIKIEEKPETDTKDLKISSASETTTAPQDHVELESTFEPNNTPQNHIEREIENLILPLIFEINDIPVIEFGNFVNNPSSSDNSYNQVHAETDLQSQLNNLRKECQELKGKILRIETAKAVKSDVNTSSEPRWVEHEKLYIADKNQELVVVTIFKNLVTEQVHHTYHHTKIPYVQQMDGSYISAYSLQQQQVAYAQSMTMQWQTYPLQQQQEAAMAMHFTRNLYNPQSNVPSHTPSPSSKKNNSGNKKSSFAKKGNGVNAALSDENKLEAGVQNKNDFKDKDIKGYHIKISDLRGNFKVNAKNDDREEYQDSLEEIEQRANDNLAKIQIIDISNNNSSSDTNLLEFSNQVLIPAKSIDTPFVSNMEPIFMGGINFNLLMEF